MTTKTRNSPYTGTDLPTLDTHRKLGDRCYMLDVDMLEYSYQDGIVKFAAVIDNKHGTAKMIKMESSTKAQMELARQLVVPFFICINFIDPDFFDIPMYYLIPISDLAKVKLNAPTWMTIRSMSKFQAELRNKVWNKFEWSAIGQCQLGELPDVYKEYALPVFKY